MKKIHIQNIKKVFIALTVLFSVSFIYAETEYICVSEGRLTKDPKAKSEVVSDVSYGAPVEILKTGDKWKLVETEDGIQGWISVKSLTPKKIKSRKVNADANEIALAGKGWASSLEQAYAESTGIDFSLIDSLEEPVTNIDEVYDFIVEGQLNLGGLE